MLHLDFFFLLGFWVQLLVLLYSQQLFLGLGVSGLVLLPTTLISFAYAARKESTKAAIIAFFLLLLETGTLLAGILFAFMFSTVLTLYRTFFERVFRYAITAIALLLATTVVAARC